MLKYLQKLGIFLVAAFCSCALVFSIPILNVLAKGGFSLEKQYTKTEVRLVKNEVQPEPPKPEKPSRKPQRMNPSSRAPKAGPRFAMDLGAIGGSGGATISADLVASQSGSASGYGEGDVDEKPSARTPPGFQAPAAIREGEIDASLRLSFCVDISGRAYDVRIVEENPPGKGLGAAGREALARASFKPARKDGSAVPFCGLEQPFEIKFKD